VVVDVTAVSVQPIADAVEIARPGATIIIAGVKGSGTAMPPSSTSRIIMGSCAVALAWHHPKNRIESHRPCPSSTPEFWHASVLRAVAVRGV
jgi:hypothetical protein